MNSSAVDHEAEPSGGLPSGNSTPGEEPVEETAKGTNGGRSASGAHSDAHGRKWIGDVPYDVWFDDPLAVAGKGAKLVGVHSAPDRPAESGPSADGALPPKRQEESNAPAGKAASAETSAAGTQAVVWKDLVTADVLDAEMISIRSNLSGALQSVGRYNAKYKEVHTMGSTLAAVAAIAAEHPDSLRWKAQAPSIRDLGTRLEESAQEAGSKSYESARRSFESLVGLLDGNPPAGLEASAARVEFSKCADRGGVMKRMDHSFQWLKKDVGVEKALRDSAEKAQHETSLLAALARVIAAPGYPSADEPEFAAHAQALLKSAQEMSRSARAGDFSGFSSARDRVQKKCNECHAEYRL